MSCCVSKILVHSVQVCGCYCKIRKRITFFLNILHLVKGVQPYSLPVSFPDFDQFWY